MMVRRCVASRRSPGLRSSPPRPVSSYVFVFMFITPSQVLVAAWLNLVGVDDADRSVRGDRNQFEEFSGEIGSDHEHPLLTVVLVEVVPDHVPPRVKDHFIGTPVLARRLRDLHRASSVSSTLG